MNNTVAGARSEIVFTEQFYYPEGWGGAQLPRDITTHLARAGHVVEVVCGSDQYAPADGDPGEDPTRAGVRILRISRLFGGDIHHRKLFRQLWFCFAALPVLLFRRRPRLYVTQTNPPLIVPIVAFVAACQRRPFVIIAQDLYPEVMIAHGVMRSDSLPARVLRSLFAWAYGRAQRVVSLGPTMSRRLHEKGVARGRTTEISNWATGEETIVRGASNKLRREWGLEGCLVLMYSGNIGIAHDVETPVFALRDALQRLPQLRLVFVGKGSRLADAERVAREAGVSHAVQFRPLVPFALLPHSLGLADLALVTLKQGFEGLVVPSKLLGYMARGVPTLYVGPSSDAQALIAASAGGLCVENGEARKLADELVTLAGAPERLAQMSRSAEQFYRDHLARPIGLERYRTVVEEISGRVSQPSAAH